LSEHRDSLLWKYPICASDLCEPCTTCMTWLAHFLPMSDKDSNFEKCAKRKIYRCSIFQVRSSSYLSLPFQPRLTRVCEWVNVKWMIFRAKGGIFATMPTRVDLKWSWFWRIFRLCRSNDVLLWNLNKWLTKQEYLILYLKTVSPSPG
jgi:hypothetical protein